MHPFSGSYWGIHSHRDSYKADLEQTNTERTWRQRALGGILENKNEHYLLSITTLSRDFTALIEK